MRAISKCALTCVALAGLLAAPSAADAQQRQLGFRACNHTGDEIEVAKAVNTGPANSRGQIAISEGWYKLPPSACTVLWSGPLQYRYYLVYAQDRNSGRQWTGSVPICISQQAFTIRSDACSQYTEQRMFRQVDVGSERTSWTHNFTP